jgi:hypothetical protein
VEVRFARIGRRLVVAASGAVVVASLVALEPAAAATATQRVSRDVTLDAAGTATIDAFDPALGTLTQVAVTIDVEVLVQGCVENRDTGAGAATGGTVRGSLAVEVPGGENTTTAAAEAAVPAEDLTGGDGTDDCTGGLADDTASFPDPVVAPDAAYGEATDAAATTAMLTASADITPFVGTGTVAITHTPASDSELAVPAEWDAVSVAMGSYRVAVTYTYTPATGSPGGQGLSRTGASIVDEVAVATPLVVLGVVAVMVSRRRRRGRVAGS